MRDAIERQKRINALQTAVLLGVLLLIMIVAGWNVLGPGGLLLAGGVFAVSVFMLSRSSRIIAIRGARRLSAYEAPQLAAMVGELSRRAGLVRVPELYYLPTRVMNAAAAGDPEDPVLFVTDGILRRLDARELEAVLAHEISHIRNRDLVVFRFAEMLRSLTATVAQFGWILLFFALPSLMVGGGISLGWLVVLIAAPSVSLVVQLGLMRTRELGADIGAVELTGDPVGLATALRKLEYPRRGFLAYQPAERSLFRTHPATEERVERLLAMLDRPRRITRSGPILRAS